MVDQCDVLVAFPVVAAASTYCTYCYLFSRLFYRFSLFCFCFSHFTFFILRLFFPLLILLFACTFFLLLDWLSCPPLFYFFPNQPTYQPPHWRSALLVYSCRRANLKFLTHLGVTFGLFLTHFPTHPLIPTTMHCIPYQFPSCTARKKIHIGTIVRTESLPALSPESVGIVLDRLACSV